MLWSTPQGLEIGLAFAGDLVISIRRQVIARIFCTSQPPPSGLEATGHNSPNRVLVHRVRPDIEVNRHHPQYESYRDVDYCRNPGGGLETYAEREKDDYARACDDRVELSRLKDGRVFPGQDITQHSTAGRIDNPDEGRGVDREAQVDRLLGAHYRVRVEAGDVRQQDHVQEGLYLGIGTGGYFERMRMIPWPFTLSGPVHDYVGPDRR